MKIYFNLNYDTFTNSYIIVNDDEKVKQVIIVDPGKITTKMIEQIEKEKYKLAAVLITHNHPSHVAGLKTLNKIYTPKIYAADYEIEGFETELLTGDGRKKIAGLIVEYFSIPGHTSDGMAFKIGNVIFTGDSISAGVAGSTQSKYSTKLLCEKVREKIFSQCDETILMPGHGPPTTTGAEKRFNLDFYKIKS